MYVRVQDIPGQRGMYRDYVLNSAHHQLYQCTYYIHFLHLYVFPCLGQELQSCGQGLEDHKEHIEGVEAYHSGNENNLSELLAGEHTLLACGGRDNCLLPSMHLVKPSCVYM